MRRYWWVLSIVLAVALAIPAGFLLLLMRDRLGGPPAAAVAPVLAAPAHIQWEYSLISAETAEDFTEKLNKASEEGWELVSDHLEQYRHSPEDAVEHDYFAILRKPK